jgi:glutamate-1-semialdehyde 2,1-aminomutase
VTQHTPPALEAFRRALREEYARRFPLSAALGERRRERLLDETSHAIRWNFPFMPTVRAARGGVVEDLDDHVIVDYWQGHFANILGHNPPLVRHALARVLQGGGGLQSGMIHEVEHEVAVRITEMTSTEAVRFTTSGTLGTFYATVLARAFTGRRHVLKVGGGWHGGQPFGLKGIVPRGAAFDRLESEGLAESIPDEVRVTRFNDVDALRREFDADGDNIACFIVEPVLGAAGGFVATREYMVEARRLTEKHGALLISDEIITGFRFRAGDLISLHGVRPDLLVLGKVMGGGMPVAAVAGRRDVLALASRDTRRVMFEGGTYAAHELSLIATRTVLEYLAHHEDDLYPRLARRGDSVRRDLAKIAASAGVELRFTAEPGDVLPGSSLVLVHVAAGDAPPTCPEELAERRHPVIDGALLKSVLLLHDVSTRTGLGALSTAHTPDDIDRTLDAYRGALERLRKAGIV